MRLANARDDGELFVLHYVLEFRTAVPTSCVINYRDLAALSDCLAARSYFHRRRLRLDLLFSINWICEEQIRIL